MSATMCCFWVFSKMKFIKCLSPRKRSLNFSSLSAGWVSDTALAIGKTNKKDTTFVLKYAHKPTVCILGVRSTYIHTGWQARERFYWEDKAGVKLKQKLNNQASHGRKTKDALRIWEQEPKASHWRNAMVESCEYHDRAQLLPQSLPSLA